MLSKWDDFIGPLVIINLEMKLHTNQNYIYQKPLITTNKVNNNEKTINRTNVELNCS